MSKTVCFFSVLSVLVIALSACNLPSGASPTSDPNAVFTAAAQTVEAQLTQSALFDTPTLPPPPTATLPPTATSIPPTATPIPPTPTSTLLCDLAQFIKDVNIPDGTEFSPGATFTKTWRLKNIGTCTWSGYSLVFDSGDSMSGPASTPIGTVAAGQEVDLSVNLTAPSTAASYRGYWRIRNAAGVLIPVQGGYQSKSFFVDIKVVAGATTAYDFHAQAPAAQWISCGDPCVGGTPLTFGGPDTDPNGFAMYRDGQRLEDGSSPAKIIETHPMWVDNGVISGLFSAYTVQSGDHLKVKLGFLAKDDGTCGAGNVVFQINYKIGGTIYPLGSWTDTCDGNLITVDLNLNSLAGQTVQFALVVLANGSAGQDWAVWANPKIVR